MRSITSAIVITLTAGTLLAADAPVPAIIPMPQKLEVREGVFKLGPQSQIMADREALPTAQYLADRLHPSTGLAIKPSDASPAAVPAGSIYLHLDPDAKATGAEGYRLQVTPDAARITAAGPAGLFHGVQTLLQLFPPAILSPRLVTHVEWLVPCVEIEDQPRFSWRGMLLDSSRHFFTKAEVERVLDQMALHKLNTFHWHLTDFDGWRLEIKKHPRLTSEGAWRQGISHGLDPRSSSTYNSAGLYGGFYTQEDIKEILTFAQARHINIVPEIEMPGHSGAILGVYPQYGCVKADGKTPAGNIGVYCVANEEVYTLLEEILDEVIGLFPSPYIHIGGDEVDKSNWAACPRCQALKQRENLKDEHALQSYFIRRVEKIINARHRAMVGWSEIRQGGIAQNAVLMDWIGGAAESAAEGHDVVMTPTYACYLDYYQSVDYSVEPLAIGSYIPLKRVYDFEPVPANLDEKYQRHILGAQANLWTEFIANARHLDFMTYPRLCALSEVAWSPKDRRNWDDFSRRLRHHYQRLDQLGIYYFEDRSRPIGAWSAGQVKPEATVLEFDVTDHLREAGKYHLLFDREQGGGVNIAWAALREDGKEVARDTHVGYAGPNDGLLAAHNSVYVLSVPPPRRGARYTIQAALTAEPNNDSQGVLRLTGPQRRPIR